MSMGSSVTDNETPDEKAAREARERLQREAQSPDSSIMDLILGFLKFLFESFFPNKEAPDEDPGDVASKPTSIAEIARIGKLIIDKKAIPKWQAYQEAHKGEAVNFVNPVEGGFRPITRDFGMHMHPLHHEMRMHVGADLKPMTPGANPNILASAGGIVLFADRKSGYGNTVIIGHADGTHTLYGHLRDLPKVEVGSEVVQGQRIGVMGRSGGADGEHLHWETRKGSATIQPQIGGVALTKGVTVPPYNGPTARSTTPPSTVSADMQRALEAAAKPTPQNPESAVEAIRRGMRLALHPKQQNERA